MKYTVKIPRQVLREIETLPGHMRQRVRRAVAELSTEPRPPGAKALRGELEGYYRVRINSYRIIYAIEDDILVVLIVRIAKRTAQTYNDLP